MYPLVLRNPDGYSAVRNDASAPVTDDEKQLPQQQTQPQNPRCPSCAAFPKLTHSMLDPRNGKTVRLYECHCGERIWDD